MAPPGLVLNGDLQGTVRVADYYCEWDPEHCMGDLHPEQKTPQSEKLM